MNTGYSFIWTFCWLDWTSGKAKYHGDDTIPYHKTLKVLVTVTVIQSVWGKYYAYCTMAIYNSKPCHAFPEICNLSPSMEVYVLHYYSWLWIVFFIFYDLQYTDMLSFFFPIDLICRGCRSVCKHLILMLLILSWLTWEIYAR